MQMFVDMPPVAEEVERVGKYASHPEGMTQDSVRSRPKAEFQTKKFSVAKQPFTDGIALRWHMA